jgi:hypothetical protein
MAAMASRANILIARLWVPVRRRAIREVYTGLKAPRNEGRRCSPAKQQPAIIPAYAMANRREPLWDREEAARFRASGSERGGRTNWGLAVVWPNWTAALPGVKRRLCERSK